LKYSCDIKKVLLVGFGEIAAAVFENLIHEDIDSIVIVETDHTLSKSVTSGIYSFKETAGHSLDYAVKRAAEVNPGIKVELCHVDYEDKELMVLVKQSDLIVDTADMYIEHKVVSERCAMLGKPYVYGHTFSWKYYVLNMMDDENNIFEEMYRHSVYKYTRSKPITVVLSAAAAMMVEIKKIMNKEESENLNRVIAGDVKSGTVSVYGPDSDIVEDDVTITVDSWGDVRKKTVPYNYTLQDLFTELDYENGHMVVNGEYVPRYLYNEVMFEDGDEAYLQMYVITH
jgi:molybdopterin/thiamine biosynthesis adenylyltransferase